ncbi:MAG: hypothetical protein IJ329_01310 [Clostridia bacterium]|nr:hypothetical protein [Clostridia bacterium]
MKKRLATKLMALLSFCCIPLSLMACDDSTKNNSNGSSSNSTSNSNSSSTKLLGDIIPEPKMDYDIRHADNEWVSLEVENADESDFRSYVDSCRPYGFDGYIQSATSPDLYYMEYNEEDYYLEVFFYEDEQSFSVYVRVPNN